MSTTEMTTPAMPARRGRWIDHWEPEDPGFWEMTGKRIANRNLWFSILSEHIGFSMWTVWSVLVLFMGKAYAIDPAGKFFLVSLPALVGGLIRIPYTMAPARFGGRNWTIVSVLLLLIPTTAALVVIQPGTSYTPFVPVPAPGGRGPCAGACLATRRGAKAPVASSSATRSTSGGWASRCGSFLCQGRCQPSTATRSARTITTCAIQA